MKTSQSRFAAIFLALALVATACGGGGSAEPASPQAASAATAAQTNMELLSGGTTAFDYEVLNVHDGSISTVEEVVDGDRAVLLWFFSPH